MNPDAVVVAREIEGLLSRFKALDDRWRPKLPLGDVRLGLIGRPGNTLHSYYFLFLSANDTMAYDAWWKDRFGADHPTPRDRQAIIDLEAMVKHATFVFVLARIEWGLRQLIGFLYPSTPVSTSWGVTFKSIYDYLFEKLELVQYTALYDICRLARNVIHSNGVHLDPAGADCEMHWAGLDYVFKHMTVIDFMDDDHTFPLYRGLADSIGAILDAPPVSAPVFIEAKPN